MLYIVSGPSSVGKSIIVDLLIKQQSFKRVVPYTSRDIRKEENETDGIEYFFRTKEEIMVLSENLTKGYWDSVFDNLYGYSIEINKSIFSIEKSIVLATTTIALAIKRNFSQVKIIFIDFETEDEMKRRISKRFDPNLDLIALKFENAKQERLNSHYFDIQLKSDDPFELYKAILSIIEL